SSRRRHTRSKRDWSSDVCSSDLDALRRRLEANGIETVAFPAIDSPAAREELYRSTLPIWRDMPHEAHVDWQDPTLETFIRSIFEIGRASCRERVRMWVDGGALAK